MYIDTKRINEKVESIRDDLKSLVAELEEIQNSSQINSAGHVYARNVLGLLYMAIDTLFHVHHEEIE